MPPEVSVVMPAHQAETTVGAAITGVLWQNGVELELVVVDDGSTDATGAVARAFSDPRLTVLRQAHAGASAARNRALDAATAPLVTLCDADDVLLPGHVRALLDVHRADGGAGLVTADAWLVPPDGRLRPQARRHRRSLPRPDRQRRAILEENFVSTMTLLPTALARGLDGFDESLDAAEDWDLWIRAILGGAVVHHQPEPLALYNRSATSVSSDVDRMERAAQAVLAKVAGRDDLTAEERAYVESRLGTPSPAALARQGAEAVQRGDHRDAARAYRRAAALAPSNPSLRHRARALSVAGPVAGAYLRRRQQRSARTPLR